MRIQEIFDTLTVEDKLRLLCGDGVWKTWGCEGKIPALNLIDGPMGVRKVIAMEHGKQVAQPSVGFPAVQTLANTWNVECVRAVGEAMASDGKEQDVDVLLAPGVNIKRHPLNGRNFEYFSEDPVLSGELGKSFIEGVQSKGVGVCLKHFCANNLEYDRFHQSSDVDERTLRELYYLPFEIACEAKPVSIMCAYNRINGTFCSEYAKGFSVLREEFGFDGAIVSDWGSVRDRRAAAIAGLDVQMPFSEYHYQQLRKDYAEGRLTDEQLDGCAMRMVRLALRCKEMQATGEQSMPMEERKTVAKQAMAEGVVLLKNNGVLPLQGSERLTVLGRYGSTEHLKMIQGGGSSCVEWIDPAFHIPNTLRARGFAVEHEDAFDAKHLDSDLQDAHRATMLAAKADVTIICAGTGAVTEYEGADRRSMRLIEVQERAILNAAAVCENTVVLLFAGSPIDVSAWADKVAAILYVGFPAMGGDEVIADLLTGKRNPCGKLSETFPVHLEDVPAANTFLSTGVTRYQEGLDVGYRYFDSYDLPVAYPFGFGLSYSEFGYADLQLQTTREGLSVEYTVSNQSERVGKEISQVYVRELVPLVYRPKKELKGFAKTELLGGEKKGVKIDLDMRAFAHWSTATDSWTVSDGVYEILVGASSADIRLQARLMIEQGKITVL